MDFYNNFDLIYGFFLINIVGRKKSADLSLSQRDRTANFLVPLKERGSTKIKYSLVLYIICIRE